jgi:HAE1 family hydrophobic/amphiphilic exporter-1
MNLGVDLSILGSSIETLLSGQNVGLWEASDGESYDIRVQIPKSERTLNTLNQLTIPGKSDDNGVAAMIPLSNIASITPSSSPRQINRTNLLRDISLTGNIEGRNKAAVFKDIQALLEATTLPEGIIKVQEGDNQNMKESGDYALQALMLGVLLIYFILTAQFRSFTLPITIMMALPLSFVGVFAGLAIGGSTLNMFSVIGIIMLMGLATKNGILLVDYINQCRSEGLSRYDAIIEGGRVRLRPILMTSLAMIIGMLPMAFATGDGSETQRPMAQAIIGGLITSTLLTLVVVPVIYTYMDSFRMLLHRLIGSGKYTPTADTQSQ